MNVGVIGGSGFVGSHLVDKLVEYGHEVTVFDIKKPHRGDVTHIHIDIADLSKTTVALTGYYDVVYLLAAVADVNDVYRNPVEATEINIAGVSHVLEAARRSNISRVILASSTWVYQLGDGGEEDTPFHVEKANHLYTSQKLAAELLCRSYQNMYSQTFTILRYGVPYGPRARDGTVLAAFVKRAFCGEPLTIFGEGNQFRNFIYVEYMINEQDYEAFEWIKNNVGPEYMKAILEPWKGAAFTAITGKNVHTWILGYPLPKDVEAREFLSSNCTDTAFLRENGISIVYAENECNNPSLKKVREHVYLLEE